MERKKNIIALDSISISISSSHEENKQIYTLRNTIEISLSILYPHKCHDKKKTQKQNSYFETFV